MSTPRKHHYLPRSYLAAWTDTGTPEGRLQVLDRSTGRSWSARPADAAKETDLYMIDLAGASADLEATEIETTFGTVESAAAPVIKRILAGEGVPSGEDYENLMAFMAVLALRVPARLRWIDNILRAPVEALYRRLEAEGAFDALGDPELSAKVKELYDRGLVRVEIKQNARLDMMVAGIADILRLLVLRRWTVLRTGHSGDLICPDHPVLLEWTKRQAPGTSPGFGLQDTAVFVPLGPSTALLGLWGSELTDATLSPERVAFWNGELLGHVDRFIFSRADFAALYRSGCTDRRMDVCARWRAGAEKPPSFQPDDTDSGS